ncbi:hypothetical protein AAG570_000819 [Ranatra chinensis]|uniref:Uncharacterized protein n=1 Tax=Ranatra chinensis TaxID=642074 RepID=A0ABD0YY59_9HEMI
MDELRMRVCDVRECGYAMNLRRVCVGSFSPLAEDLDSTFLVGFVFTPRPRKGRTCCASSEGKRPGRPSRLSSCCAGTKKEDNDVEDMRRKIRHLETNPTQAGPELHKLYGVWRCQRDAIIFRFFERSNPLSEHADVTLPQIHKIPQADDESLGRICDAKWRTLWPNEYRIGGGWSERPQLTDALPNLF